MTDPKLREAWIAEALQRAMVTQPVTSAIQTKSALAHLIDLIEFDWRPEPEVDAVTLAAREWMATEYPNLPCLLDAGRLDDHDVARAFRAGHAHALANCADVERMDWLEGQNFIQATDVGGKFMVACFGDELRTKIDKRMEGGE